MSDSWSDFRKYTDARIALGRSGGSLPTTPLLKFQLDHARARDAVYSEVDWKRLESDLQDVRENYGIDLLRWKSRASDRTEYLKRPDLGRRLLEQVAQPGNYGEESPAPGSNTGSPRDEGGSDFQYDVILSIVDGLSGRAIDNNAAAFVNALFPELLNRNWSPGPIVFVEQGRVAIGDEVGQRLRARLMIVLIGERPGLSSPDSMGLYMTYNPSPGLTDERRNCISNIRDGGLAPGDAVKRLLYLADLALKRGTSGVLLKDESGPLLEGPGDSPELPA